MFREILLSAGLTGLLAALLLTLAQAVWITPLILQAETYENTGAASAAAHSDAHAHSHGAEQSAETAHAHDHHHDANAWAPADGLQRTAFTLLSNVVMGFGYALLLIGAYTLWRQPKSIAQGLLFGLAGFTVFFAAPGLGLPPELPGTEAADLFARQQWWVGTAAATAIGLALLFAQKNWLLRGAGLVVLLAPHLIGAPHPAVAASLAPAELQTQFRLATVVCNALFWLPLGAASTFALQKFSNSQQSVS